MPKASVLFYDPGPSPWAPKFRQLCAIQGLRLRIVAQGDLGRRVGALAQGLCPGEEPPAVPSIPEPVLLFCFLSEGQLDRMLRSLQKLGVPRSCLKAILTPDNASWTFRALYDELAQERAQLS